MRATKIELTLIALVLAVLGLGLLLAACQGSAPPETPVERGYECAVYHEAGCATEVIADGGELEVLDGGVVDMQAGSSFNFALGSNLTVTNNLTAYGTVNLTKTNAAGGGVNPFDWTGTLAAENGSDTVEIIDINLTNANHTGASNVVTGIDIANITGDADATETGFKVGTGWDYGLYSGSPLYEGSTSTFAGNATFNHGTVLTASGTAHISETATMSGTLTTEGAITSRAGLAGTTVTASGLASLNAGIAVDSSAFTVADSTGNVKTTGLYSSTPISYTSTGAQNLTPTTNWYLIDSGSAVSLTLQDIAVQGTMLCLVNTTANRVEVVDSNVLTSGGTLLHINEDDGACFLFANSIWYELFAFTDS